MLSGMVYVLCAATALVCAWLLLRAYTVNRSSMLFWSGLCFVCLGLSNVLLVVDRLILPDVDLSVWRLLPSVVGMCVLLYGLIWHE